MTTTVEQREATYWDQQAAQVSDDHLRSEPASETTASPDELTDAFLKLIGPVAGKRVLDIGCGTGAWAVHMARAGADVWAIDISPQSIAVAQRRAQLNGVSKSLHASVQSATASDFPDRFFDVVYGQDIIHHLDAHSFGREVARLLAPGGHACFYENCANNPILMFARNHLCGRFGIPRWSSDDEYPLTRAKLGDFARPFSGHTVHYPKFVCFFYFDAKLFRYRSRIVSWICTKADALIYRLFPFLRQYSYRQLIKLECPVAKAPA
jgi:ubiquinone/menaquinone biosynthesis C-methylase UbiE